MNTRNLLTLISVVILVGVEVVAAGVAFGWAVGSYFQLGRDFTLGFAAVGAAAGLYATWSFYKMARRVEIA